MHKNTKANGFWLPLKPRMPYNDPMYEKYHEKIADLLLFAVNFQRGDKLYLNIDYGYREVAKIIAAKAYGGGATYIDLFYNDTFLHAEAIRGVSGAFWFPRYLSERLSEISKAGWKFIAILSNAEADVFANLPQDRSSAYFKAMEEIKSVLRKAQMSHRIPWTLTFLPSEEMSKKAFPKLSPREGMERYWKAVVKIMRLDHEDPVAFWKKKMEEDWERSGRMNRLSPEALRFTGPGTDLTVGLNRNALWIGGFDRTAPGERFMANIPTDEIFTSPDWRRAEGRVALTRPFVMHQNLGPIPEGAWFEFQEGRVVDYGAEKGKKSLDAFFAIDERSVYLGEVALVDPQSPFAAAGITFYNGLYDENAACHLALGKAYPFTLKEQGDFSDTELLDLGLNTGNVHEDMMVGGPEVDVTALTAEGKEVPIIRGGEFLI